jgi:uncharacterized protein YndB with AHSA1/START domain
MFGAQVASQWTAGSPIVWAGEWNGKAYEDKGVILELEAGRLLKYSHFSPLSGLPDAPDNYHTVTIELSQQPPVTHVSLSQDNNANEQSREHSERNWRLMLSNLKTLLEN